MATGTGDAPFLRGYVPYGELQVHYGLLRRVIGFEIPMWEGCGYPYLRSPIMPGASGVWVYPTLLAAGPSWSWNPNAGNTGWPRGQNAVQVYAKNGKVIGGQGLQYLNILDPVISQFVVGVNFSFLAVGTPMAYQNPNLVGTERGNSHRTLFQLKTAGGTEFHRLAFNYSLDTIQYYEYAAVGIGTPIVPYYGERCAFLFVHGRSDVGGETNPRGYIAKEDGTFTRLDFLSNPGTVGMIATSKMNVFNSETPTEGASAGGTWEYLAYFIRAFTDEEACAICRDALGFLRWDPYVVRRIGWTPELHQLTATPLVYPRVSARPTTRARVSADPAFRPRLSATPSTRPRVSAEPETRARISARVLIANQEIDMRATPLCPAALNWNADNILELADVMDDLPETPTEITSANSVECHLYDADTGIELPSISPVSLSQVGSTNHWRASVLVNEANNFAPNQRISYVFEFDGGAGLTGTFYALGVVEKKAP